MKSVVILCAVVIVASAIKQELYKLQTERLLAVIDNFGKPCAPKDSDVKILVSKVADASLPRDAAHNEFLYCFAFKAGYVQKDGHIIVDGIAGILGKHPLVEEMKTSLRKCNEITKEDPIQTTVAMNNCIAETAPVRFVFDL